MNRERERCRTFPWWFCWEFLWISVKINTVIEPLHLSLLPSLAQWWWSNSAAVQMIKLWQNGTIQGSSDAREGWSLSGTAAWFQRYLWKLLWRWDKFKEQGKMISMAPKSWSTSPKNGSFRISDPQNATFFETICTTQFWAMAMASHGPSHQEMSQTEKQLAALKAELEAWQVDESDTGHCFLWAPWDTKFLDDGRPISQFPMNSQHPKISEEVERLQYQHVSFRKK